MSDVRIPNPVTLRAPIKVNLHLGIHPGRDGRGYHRADSVMAALDLGDVVRVGDLPATVDLPAEAEGVQLRMSEDVGIPFRKNTAWLAASRLRTALVSPVKTPSTATERSIDARATAAPKSHPLFAPSAYSMVSSTCCWP